MSGLPCSHVAMVQWLRYSAEVLVGKAITPLEYGTPSPSRLRLWRVGSTVCISLTLVSAGVSLLFIGGWVNTWPQRAASLAGVGGWILLIVTLRLLHKRTRYAYSCGLIGCGFLCGFYGRWVNEIVGVISNDPIGNFQQIDVGGFVILGIPWICLSITTVLLVFATLLANDRKLASVIDLPS